MSAHTGQTSIDLPCHRCGYDLRAHPHDGQCPECGASVAESRRLAAVPLRPAWRDSDPRWRRRILAGAWVLVLLPLVDVLKAFDLASGIPVPAVFEHGGTVRTLDDTLLSFPGVYQPLAFCIGVVLLFSKERGRRRGRLDWTRRWGVICCYAVLLLSAAGILALVALVCVGIAAAFHSMPLDYQPGIARPLAEWGTAYIRYGPQPSNASGVVLVASSSIAILLACVPLFDALRGSGPRRYAAALLAPLALFALMHLAQAGRYLVAFGFAPTADLFPYGAYFWPEVLVTRLAGLPPGPGVPGTALGAVVEAVKWCSVFSIAVWLTVARIAAWGQRSETLSDDAKRTAAEGLSGVRCSGDDERVAGG